MENIMPPGLDAWNVKGCHHHKGYHSCTCMVGKLLASCPMSSVTPTPALMMSSLARSLIRNTSSCGSACSAVMSSTSTCRRDAICNTQLNDLNIAYILMIKYQKCIQ